MSVEEYYESAVESFIQGRFEDVAEFGYRALTEMPENVYEIHINTLHLLLNAADIHWRGQATFSEYRLNFQALLDDAILLAADAVDYLNLAQFMLIKGLYAGYRENVQNALDIMQNAWEYAQHTEDTLTLIWIRANLAHAHTQFNLAEGMVILHEALSTFETYVAAHPEIPFSPQLANIRYRLYALVGESELEAGNYEVALHLLQEALQGFRQLGISWALPSLGYRVARVYAELGQWETAENILLDTVGSLDATQAHDVWKALNLALLGKIYLETRRLVKAKSPILLSLQSPHLEGNRAIYAQILLYSAEYYLAVRQYDLAEDALQTALNIALDGKWHGLIVRALSLLANVNLVQGQIDRAYHTNQDAIEYLERMGGNLPGIQPQWVYYMQALILHHGHQPHEAQGHLIKAKALVTERATTLRDPALRQSYLKNIAIHQELMT